MTPRCGTLRSLAGCGKTRRGCHFEEEAAAADEESCNSPRNCRSFAVLRMTSLQGLSRSPLTSAQDRRWAERSQSKLLPQHVGRRLPPRQPLRLPPRRSHSITSHASGKERRTAAPRKASRRGNSTPLVLRPAFRPFRSRWCRSRLPRHRKARTALLQSAPAVRRKPFDELWAATSSKTRLHSEKSGVRDRVPPA